MGGKVYMLVDGGLYADTVRTLSDLFLKSFPVWQ